MTCFHHRTVLDTTSPLTCHVSRRGYFCTQGQHCALLISSSTVPTVTCSAGSSVDFTYLTIPYTITKSSSISTITTFSAMAPLLQMLYRASDVSATSTSKTATTTTPTAQSHPSHAGLSVGASVGIAIGVAVFVIAVASAAVFTWLRKRRNRMKTRSNHSTGSGTRFLGNEAAKTVSQPAVELQSQAELCPSELDSRKTPGELDSNHGGLHELQ